MTRVRAPGGGGGGARFCAALRGVVPGREAVARVVREPSPAAAGERANGRRNGKTTPGWRRRSATSFSSGSRWFGGMEYEWRSGPKPGPGRFLGVVVVERPAAALVGIARRIRAAGAGEAAAAGPEARSPKSEVRRSDGRSAELAAALKGGVAGMGKAATLGP